MIRYPLAFTALLLAGTTCFAQQRNHFPQAQGMKDEGPKQATGGPMANGPQGPQVAGSDQPVPKNAPPATVRNVPATSGHANIATSAPPFAVAEIGRFKAPFAMAFLPNGALLVTEKAGRLKLRDAKGGITVISGVPAVAKGGAGRTARRRRGARFRRQPHHLSQLCRGRRQGQRSGAGAGQAVRRATR